MFHYNNNFLSPVRFLMQQTTAMSFSEERPAKRRRTDGAPSEPEPAAASGSDAPPTTTAEAPVPSNIGSPTPPPVLRIRYATTQELAEMKTAEANAKADAKADAKAEAEADFRRRIVRNPTDDMPPPRARHHRRRYSAPMVLQPHREYKVRVEDCYITIAQALNTVIADQPPLGEDKKNGGGGPGGKKKKKGGKGGGGKKKKKKGGGGGARGGKKKKKKTKKDQPPVRRAYIARLRQEHEDLNFLRPLVTAITEAMLIREIDPVESLDPRLLEGRPAAFAAIFRSLHRREEGELIAVAPAGELSAECITRPINDAIHALGIFEIPEFHFLRPHLQRETIAAAADRLSTNYRNHVVTLLQAKTNGLARHVVAMRTSGKDSAADEAIKQWTGWFAQSIRNAVAEENRQDPPKDAFVAMLLDPTDPREVHRVFEEANTRRVPRVPKEDIATILDPPSFENVWRPILEELGREIRRIQDLVPRRTTHDHSDQAIPSRQGSRGDLDKLGRFADFFTWLKHLQTTALDSYRWHWEEVRCGRRRPREGVPLPPFRLTPQSDLSGDMLDMSAVDWVMTAVPQPAAAPGTDGEEARWWEPVFDLRHNHRHARFMEAPNHTRNVNDVRLVRIRTDGAQAQMVYRMGLRHHTCSSESTCGRQHRFTEMEERLQRAHQEVHDLVVDLGSAATTEDRTEMRKQATMALRARARFPELGNEKEENEEGGIAIAGQSESPAAAQWHPTRTAPAGISEEEAALALSGQVDPSLSESSKSMNPRASRQQQERSTYPEEQSVTMEDDDDEEKKKEEPPKPTSRRADSEAPDMPKAVRGGEKVTGRHITDVEARLRADQVLSLFRGTLQRQVEDADGTDIMIRDEDFYVLPLRVRGDAALDETTLRQATGVIGMGFTRLPQQLVIQLNRVRLQPPECESDGQEVSLAPAENHRLEFPDELDLREFVVPGTCGGKDPQKVDAEYRLRGVIAHRGHGHGSVRPGHSWCYVRKPGEVGASGRWRRFDDDEVTDGTLPETAYGGMLDDRWHEEKPEPYGRAHLLFYEKKGRKEPEETTPGEVGFLTPRLSGFAHSTPILHQLFTLPEVANALQGASPERHSVGAALKALCGQYQHSKRPCDTHPFLEAWERADRLGPVGTKELFLQLLDQIVQTAAPGHVTALRSLRLVRGKGTPHSHGGKAGDGRKKGKGEAASSFSESSKSMDTRTRTTGRRQQDRSALPPKQSPVMEDDDDDDDASDDDQEEEKELPKSVQQQETPDTVTPPVVGDTQLEEEETVLLQTTGKVPGSLFRGTLRQRVENRAGVPEEHQFVSETNQEFTTLQLELEGNTTIEDALSREQDVKYRGPGGSVAAKKSFKFLALPEILVIQLVRFRWTEDGSIKNNDYIHFPDTLDLRDYMVPGQQPEDAIETMYRLRGVVVHEEWTSTTGHYWSFVRLPPGAGGGCRWRRFEDHQVMDTRDLPETVYGGGERSDGNAYLLLYERGTRRQSPPTSAGLTNPRRLCYANSVMQQLFAIPEVVDALAATTTTGTGTGLDSDAGRMFAGLKSLCMSCHSGSTVCNPLPLMEAWAELFPGRNWMTYNDAEEFLTPLIDQLEAGVTTAIVTAPEPTRGGGGRKRKRPEDEDGGHLAPSRKRRGRQETPRRYKKSSARMKEKGEDDESEEEEEDGPEQEQEGGPGGETQQQQEQRTASTSRKGAPKTKERKSRSTSSRTKKPSVRMKGDSGVSVEEAPLRQARPQRASKRDALHRITAALTEEEGGEEGELEDKDAEEEEEEWAPQKTRKKRTTSTVTKRAKKPRKRKRRTTSPKAAVAEDDDEEKVPATSQKKEEELDGLGDLDRVAPHLPIPVNRQGYLPTATSFGAAWRSWDKNPRNSEEARKKWWGEHVSRVIPVDPGILQTLVASVLEADDDVMSVVLDNPDAVPNESKELMDLVQRLYASATFRIPEERAAFDALVSRYEYWDAQRRARLGVDEIFTQHLAVPEGLKSGAIGPLRQYIQAYVRHWRPHDGPSLWRYLFGDERALAKWRFRRACARRRHLHDAPMELLRWANGEAHEEALQPAYGKKQVQRRRDEVKQRRRRDRNLRPCVTAFGGGEFKADWRGHVCTAHRAHRERRLRLLKHLVVDEAYTSKCCPACRAALRDANLEEQRAYFGAEAVERERKRRREDAAERKADAREAAERAQGRFPVRKRKMPRKKGRHRGGYGQQRPKEYILEEKPARKRPGWCHREGELPDPAHDRLRVCDDCGAVWERDRAATINIFLKFIYVVVHGRYPKGLPAYQGRNRFGGGRRRQTRTHRRDPDG